MDMERFAYITIVVSASFALGFIVGYARAKSKYIKKQKKLTRRVQVLENFKHAVKVLCPKIKSEDEASGKFLRTKIKGVYTYVAPTKNIEDEDTETVELKIEKVTKGSPDDA